MAGQIIKVPATGNYKSSQNSRAAIASWKMPVRGRLSDKYGWRKHPVYRKRLFHAGIDIAAPKGAPIAATANGKVIYAGRRSGYGNPGDNQPRQWSVDPLRALRSILVKKARTKAGQLVARVGATGIATGNHLHLK